MLKQELSSDSAILTWLVVHAAQILNCYKVLENGRTPYEYITGHRLKAVTVPFGERVHFMTAPDKNAKKLTNWKTGIYLGINMKTTELMVGNSDGIHMMRTIRRQVEDSRWNQSNIEEIKTTVSEAFGGADSDGALVVPARLSPAEPAVSRGGRFQPRPVYMRPKDFEKYGFTGGCPGCVALQSGLGHKRNHSDECRHRMEEEMLHDPEDRQRVDTATDRMDHFLAEKLAEGSSASREVPPPLEEAWEAETQQTEHLKLDELEVEHEIEPAVAQEVAQDMEEPQEELVEAPDQARYHRKIKEMIHRPAKKRSAE